ncbi:RHS repeat-associated core domain-containing protein [Loktanella agnita]|uniref:RHS repeat-associated core domain-containing protein n=1 Tax=Loktanella agnita TaxID=287097 RepID=UPI0039879810
MRLDKWFQSETGLHQNWMRDYDPTLGRYLQADPLGLVDGASVYGYALQNPGRYVDPKGEAIWLPAIAGAALFGGANLSYQLYMNGGDFRCVNWMEVGLWAAAGAFTGGLIGHAAKGLPVFRQMTDAAARSKFRKAYGLRGLNVEVGHALVPARNLSGFRVRGLS